MAAWIFLRGLTREAAHWGGFPAEFRHAVPEAQVIALDLPGNGQFHAQRSPLSVPAMVAACRSELARRGVKPPYYLLAMSLGAMVATQWARTAPAEVTGCVLINTSFHSFNPFYRRLHPRNYPALLRLALLAGSPAAIEQTVLRLTSNHPEQHLDVMADWVAARQQRPVSSASALRQLIAAARYSAPTTRPIGNTLLLASQHDQLVDSRCSQAIARAWGCPLAFHPFAGHDLPLDDPLWVAEQVRRWLHDRPLPA